MASETVEPPLASCGSVEPSSVAIKSPDPVPVVAKSTGSESIESPDPVQVMAKSSGNVSVAAKSVEPHSVATTSMGHSLAAMSVEPPSVEPPSVAATPTGHTLAVPQPLESTMVTSGPVVPRSVEPRIIVQDKSGLILKGTSTLGSLSAPGKFGSSVKHPTVQGKFGSGVKGLSVQGSSAPGFPSSQGKPILGPLQDVTHKSQNLVSRHFPTIYLQIMSPMLCNAIYFQIQKRAPSPVCWDESSQDKDVADLPGPSRVRINVCDPSSPGKVVVSGFMSETKKRRERRKRSHARAQAQLSALIKSENVRSGAVKKGNVRPPH